MNDRLPRSPNGFKPESLVSIFLEVEFSGKSSASKVLLAALTACLFGLGEAIIVADFTKGLVATAQRGALASKFCPEYGGSFNLKKKIISKNMTGSQKVNNINIYDKPINLIKIQKNLFQNLQKSIYTL